MPPPLYDPAGRINIDGLGTRIDFGEAWAPFQSKLEDGLTATVRASDALQTFLSPSLGTALLPDVTKWTSPLDAVVVNPPYLSTGSFTEGLALAARSPLADVLVRTSESLTSMQTSIVPRSLDLSTMLTVPEPLTLRSLWDPEVGRIGSAYTDSLATVSAAAASMFETVGRIGAGWSDASTVVSPLLDRVGSLDVSALRTFEAPSWLSTGSLVDLDRVTTSATRLMTTPLTTPDVAGVLAGFERVATWNEPDWLAAVPSADRFRAALSEELPAVVRYAAAASAEPGVDMSHQYVQIATAWVQGAASRLRVVFPPDVFVGMVWKLALTLATIAAAAYGTTRIVGAILEGTEAVIETLEAVHAEPPQALETTHLVVTEVGIHVEPDASAPHVGRAHPNQTVRVEQTRGGWCWVVFTDEVEGVTRTGWVAKEGLRER